MRRSSFALRLQPALLAEAREVAQSEGVALNQLINVAVAEKISALRTEEYFADREPRANREKIARILKRVGKANPPLEGDELPPEPAAKAKRRAKSFTGLSG
jgi:HicB family